MRPHFLTELRKSASDKLGKCSRTLLLNDCVSWMTAIGNDCSYEDVFLRQLENFGVAGDERNLANPRPWASRAGPSPGYDPGSFLKTS